ILLDFSDNMPRQYAKQENQPRLSDDLVYHAAGHISEAEGAALELIGKARVVDAERVENGRVQVVNVDWVFDDVVAEVVRFAEGYAGLDATAGQPHGEAPGVVVASVVIGR